MANETLTFSSEAIDLAGWNLELETKETPRCVSISRRFEFFERALSPGTRIIRERGASTSDVGTKTRFASARLKRGLAGLKEAFDRGVYLHVYTSEMERRGKRKEGSLIRPVGK